MVPEAGFRSYYGLPILKEPVWRSPEIPGYFFLGGLAGVSSVLAAAAQSTGRPRLALRTKVAAAAAVIASLIALVSDLGRPGRFYNMLRIFKPTSPMNVGSWLLSVYGPLALTAAGSAATELLPGLGTAATFGAAVLGPAVASYTAVLVADTAVPAWHGGRSHMPYVFVSSAAAAAGGFGLLAAPAAETGPARRLGVAGAVGEIVLTKAMARSMGRPGEAYEQGRARRYLRLSSLLGAAGVAGVLFGSRRGRPWSVLSGLALMASSACGRLGIFEAGRQSARDPDHTVGPQRPGTGG